MFVVKRPFRNNGTVLTAGSVISEPASIKRFRSRLGEEKIVEVTRANFKEYKSYFLEKFGVDITPKTEKPANAQKTDAETKAPAKAKVTVKAAAK